MSNPFTRVTTYLDARDAADEAAYQEAKAAKRASRYPYIVGAIVGAIGATHYMNKDN